MRASHAGLAVLLWLTAQGAGAQPLPAAAPESAPDAPPDSSPPDPLPPREDEPGPLTEAELEALGLEVGENGLDTDLHLSGFMDVNYFALLNPSKAPLNALAYGDKSSFLVGRLNLYATKNITEDFSMMVELRFTYSPNGSQVAGSTGIISTQYSQVLDYAGSGSSVRWGGVVIERAHGDWSPFPFLTLRIGAFLTPYGIWNVDHGSPVVIPVTRPYAVAGFFFPERQTGIELFGRYGLTNHLTTRYHLTVSNGLGPVSEYRDFDENKAVGGRLVLEYEKLGTFQLGGSVFHGKNSSGQFGFGVSDDGKAVTLERNVVDASMVTSVAADLLWKYRGLHLQGEWVGQRVTYQASGRNRLSTAGQLGIPVNAVFPDVFNLAAYLLLGYRLPWWGIMPFATVEYQRSNNYGLDTETWFTKAGLNIRPASAIVVKLTSEYAFRGSPGTQVKFLASQVAWAF